MSIEKNKMITVRKSKSGQQRSIPIDDELYQELRGLVYRSKGLVFKKGLVFPSPMTERRRYGVQKPWYRTRKKAGVEDFRFHDLRHTYASHLVMAGGDINTVKGLMGHFDIRMTVQYSHLSPKHKIQAVETLAKYREKTRESVDKTDPLTDLAKITGTD